MRRDVLTQGEAGFSRKSLGVDGAEGYFGGAIRVQGSLVDAVQLRTCVSP
jgi:hypothetical protein